MNRAFAGLSVFFVAFLAAAEPPPPDAGAPAAAAVEAPPAPTFEGWSIKSDVELARPKIDEIEARIGGKIKALRSVVYAVAGQRVQLNVIVSPNSDEADKIVKAITSVKPEWTTARKGDVVYEFVGKNESEAEIRKAREKLSNS